MSETAQRASDDWDELAKELEEDDQSYVGRQQDSSPASLRNSYGSGTTASLPTTYGSETTTYDDSPENFRGTAHIDGNRSQSDDMYRYFQEDRSSRRAAALQHTQQTPMITQHDEADIATILKTDSPEVTGASNLHGVTDIDEHDLDDKITENAITSTAL